MDELDESDDLKPQHAGTVEDEDAPQPEVARILRKVSQRKHYALVVSRTSGFSAA